MAFDDEIRDFVEAYNQSSNRALQRNAAALDERKFMASQDEFNKSFGLQQQQYELDAQYKKGLIDQAVAKLPYEIREQKLKNLKSQQDIMESKIGILSKRKGLEILDYANNYLKTQQQPSAQGQPTNIPSRQSGQQALQSYMQGSQPTPQGLPFEMSMTGGGDTNIKLLDTLEMATRSAKFQELARGPQKEVADRTLGLAQQLRENPVVENYENFKPQVETLVSTYQKVLDGDIRAGNEFDNLAGTLYQAWLEPKTGVKEAEFNRLGNNLPPLEKFRNIIAQQMKGGVLTPESRELLVKIGLTLANNRGKAYNSFIERNLKGSGRLGVDTEAMSEIFSQHVDVAMPLKPGQKPPVKIMKITEITEAE